MSTAKVGDSRSEKYQMAAVDEPHDEDEKDETPGFVVPPDGGFGWVVTAASFLCNLVVDGIIFSFGVMMMDLVAAFGESTSTTAWVGSLMSGFYMMVGPFVSALANKFGLRFVALLGSVLGCIAFVISSFATSVSFLCVTYGFLGGLGFGMVYVPAVIIVGFYFEKKRALATGIAVCGSGIGTFVFAPFTSWLIELYGWRGTLLIQAGLILNCAVFASMFRPLEPVNKRRQRNNDKLPASTGTPLMLRIKRARDEKLETSDSASNLASNNGSQVGVNPTPNMAKLLIDKQKRVSTCSAPEVDNTPDPEGENLLQGNQQKKLGSVRSLAKSKTSLTRDAEPGPLDREDIFFHGSLQRLPQYRSQDAASYHASVTRLPAVSNNHEESPSSSSCCACIPAPVRRTLSSMLQISLISSPTFIIITFSGFFTMMGFFVPFMYLADRAKLMGEDRDSAAFLLSIIGITNTAGRVACGWLADHPKVDVLWVNNIALTIGGLATVISPFFDTYTMLMVYACVFGLAIACFASLRSIMIVEFLGLENLTNAFGLMLLFTGLAATVGGPVAGMFFDMTGDYNASFYISGSFIMFSGVVCYPLACINRWEKRRKSTRSTIAAVNA